MTTDLPPDDEPPSAPDPADRSGPVAALTAAGAAVLRPMRDLLSHMTPREQPLELQILGRTLFHAALVGLGAGILGCAFFAGAELLQNLLLEQLAGYEPLRAHGEKVWGPASDPQLRLWLILCRWSPRSAEIPTG